MVSNYPLCVVVIVIDNVIVVIVIVVVCFVDISQYTNFELRHIVAKLDPLILAI